MPPLNSPVDHDTSVMPLKVKPDFCGAVTVSGALPDLVESAPEVAVTETWPAEFGAVKSPAEDTVPAEADQFTAELKLPVPWTVAEHGSVSPSARVGLGQATVTEVMAGAGVGVGVGEEEEEDPPPQPASTAQSASKRTWRRVMASPPCG